MIRVETITPKRVNSYGGNAVVHAAVVHAKRKPGRYLDPEARRAYRREWMRRKRAQKAASASWPRWPATDVAAPRRQPVRRVGA